MSSSFACTRATVSAQAVADNGANVADDQRHPTPGLAALWTQFIAFAKLRRSMVSLKESQARVHGVCPCVPSFRVRRSTPNGCLLAASSTRESTRVE